MTGAAVPATSPSRGTRQEGGQRPLGHRQRKAPRKGPGPGVEGSTASTDSSGTGTTALRSSGTSFLSAGLPDPVSALLVVSAVRPSYSICSASRSDSSLAHLASLGPDPLPQKASPSRSCPCPDVVPPPQDAAPATVPKLQRDASRAARQRGDCSSFRCLTAAGRTFGTRSHSVVGEPNLFIRHTPQEPALHRRPANRQPQKQPRLTKSPGKRSQRPHQTKPCEWTPLSPSTTAPGGKSAGAARKSLTPPSPPGPTASRPPAPRPGPARQGLDQQAQGHHRVTEDRRDKSSRLMSQRV